VQLADTKLGKVVVDLAGFTLYFTTKDTSATASTCTGGCATAWPAVTGPATVGAGLDSGAITTLQRDDGTKQLAYKGHPLYYFAEDHQPGDTLGQGVGGVWFALNASGTAITG
jgi:predicted lipoprotein with Yx(FWY)xxD motif